VQRMKNNLSTIVGIAMLAFFCSANAGQVYKWIDENGKTHYGDRTGAEARQVEEVRVSKTRAVGSDITARQQRTDGLLDSYKKEREEKAESRQAAAGGKRDREAKCAAAMISHEKFERVGSLYSKDAQGNRFFLSDEDRGRAIAEAQAAVNEWCL
jgi:hypothetical protein